METESDLGPLRYPKSVLNLDVRTDASSNLSSAFLSYLYLPRYYSESVVRVEVMFMSPLVPPWQEGLAVVENLTSCVFVLF